MKITLDHNCLIDIAQSTPTGKRVKAIVHKGAYKCHVVNIGASEMLSRGIFPDRYDLFEEFLRSIELEHLERIDPVGMYNVTFWNKCVYAEEGDELLLEKIDDILFPKQIEGFKFTGQFDSPQAKKWLNRVCDVRTLHSHIKKDNDIFLTSDSNFMKQTKLHRLIALGAKEIRRPIEINV